VGAELDARGWARITGLMDGPACAALRERWAEERAFRARVVMARHGFGRGEYRYFADPLPPPVAELRRVGYAGLAPVARRWAERLGRADVYPETLGEFARHCAEAGQTRPTPLLLRYAAGDLNALHQDVYGAVVFPLQLVVLLSRPGVDFAGGELVLVEQRPRAQSIAHVVALRQGDAAVFPVRERPVAGRHGFVRTGLRHGVAAVQDGLRFTLGVIFHDAT
jgi:hypothetical protein